WRTTRARSAIDPSRNGHLYATTRSSRHAISVGLDLGPRLIAATNESQQGVFSSGGGTESSQHRRTVRFYVGLVPRPAPKSASGGSSQPKSEWRCSRATLCGKYECGQPGLTPIS